MDKFCEGLVNYLLTNYLIFALVFRTSWPKMVGFGSKMGKGCCDVNSNELVFTIGGS